MTGVARAAPVHPSVLHVLLERATPAAGDTVVATPPELVLTFSGPIEQAGVSLRLVGPEGEAERLEGARRSDDPRTLAAPLRALAPGAYRVEWRVISSDGHPIAGELVFFVRGAHGDPVVADPPRAVDGRDEAERATSGLHALHGNDGTGGPHIAPVQIASRAVADLALLLATGMLFFGVWGPWPVATSGSASRTTSRTRTTTGALLASAPVLTLAYAWLWAGEIVGGSTAAGSEARLEALATLASGRALVLESTLVVLAAWAFFLARRSGLATVFAATAVISGAFSGHPASYTPALSVPANALHQLAAAAWMGGLLFLVTETGSSSFMASMQRVSRIALASALLVTATGLVQTWLLLGAPEELIGAPYGWFVVAKLTGLTVLVGFGVYHRFWLLPRLGRAAQAGDTASGSAASASGLLVTAPSLALELMAGVVVVILAAILSHIPPSP